VLHEGRRAVDRVALPVDDDRRAVEEQFVVAAHLVHVDERHLVAPSNGREDVVAGLSLAGVEGGGGDVEDDVDVLPRQVVDRIPAVELRAEDLVVEPEVLADEDPDTAAGQVDRFRAAARLEVALLVEDVIRRQQAFLLRVDDRSAVGDDGRVVDRFAAPALVSPVIAASDSLTSNDARRKTSRSSRSRGGYPVTASSGTITRSAPAATPSA
jgi:hypothetical protein